LLAQSRSDRLARDLLVGAEILNRAILEPVSEQAHREEHVGKQVEQRIVLYDVPPVALPIEVRDIVLLLAQPEVPAELESEHLGAEGPALSVHSDPLGGAISVETPIGP
jgi:hypothetical protein